MSNNIGNRESLQYIEITHSGAPILLTDFLISNKIGIPGVPVGITAIEILKWEDNEEQIKSKSTPFQLIFTPETAFVNPGTVVKVPTDWIQKKLILKENILVPNDNFEAFLGENIKAILNDVDYRPISLPTSKTLENMTYRFLNSVSVWIWSKGLGKDDEKGKLMDITPFVMSLNTNVSKTGGNFSVQLAPAVAEFLSNDEEWGIQEKTAIKFDYNGRFNFIQRASNKFLKAEYGDNILPSEAEGEYMNLDNLVMRRARTLFHSIVKTNDVLFIKFETLEGERKLRDLENSELSLEDLFLEYKNLTNGENRGQKQLFDMIGLVDVNSETYVSGAAETDIQIEGRDLMKLILEDGEYFFPASQYSSNGGVISDEEDDPTMKRLFGELNFYEAFEQQPIPKLLEFILGKLANVEVVDGDLFTYYGEERTKNIDGVPTRGIWQIVKLIVDEELSNRKVVDSSLLTDQGNLFSFINGKIIQEPFAEFYGDTWGNQYYFIARKPPFDQKSYKSLAELAINIREEDVYGTTLVFDEQEAYSWYHITPSAMFFGDSKTETLEYFPAKYFAPYARIWGSRPYSITHNYSDFQAFGGTTKEGELSFQTSQATQDLAYMIETNAYKPFTRKGTITIKGDRRIKIGTCIRLKGTREIFYVESVSNNFSISEGITDRTTTLSVSRGMVEDYIEGKEETIYEDGVKKKAIVSYFNIIDLKKDSNGSSTSSDFKTNKGIFNFFLKGRQFKE